jgi:hypothetical protein
MEVDTILTFLNLISVRMDPLFTTVANCKPPVLVLFCYVI